jgi:hypothetical protein
MIINNTHRDGPRNTRAASLQGGIFGVHRDLGWGRTFGDSWTLTHARSGRAVKVGLCCRASAVALAEALKSLQWNFTMSRKYAMVPFPKRVRESMEEAGAIVRDWKCPVHAATQLSKHGEDEKARTQKGKAC